MKYYYPPRNKHNNIISNLKLSGVFILLLVIVFTAPTASAVGPAAEASCSGIKSAYPILGIKCEKSYAKINHAPINKKERLSSFKARKVVLEIFRKALICNGMYGASRMMQERFITSEDGHLEALENLDIQIKKHDVQNSVALYTEEDLNKISIKKQQCE